MLVQTEHLLSFQLIGIECQISGVAKIGEILLDTHDFLDSNSRWFADEADENFTRFELIYRSNWAFLESNNGMLAQNGSITRFLVRRL